MITVKTGVTAATAAALIALAAVQTAPAFAGAKTAPCYGVNSCKGTSDCKTSEHACKGQNDCKGHGFKLMTAKACKAAGGSMTEKKM